jgi:intein/homing endonuclease
MKFDENLAAIHGYLCADGYVVKNPNLQKHKYYHIGLRNTCSVLLEDFRIKCNSAFKINPIIYRNERCKFGSKEVYNKLTKHYSFYSSEWELPKLSKRNLAKWLRAYFDCDGWVFVEERQNRHIGLDSINHNGLIQIKKALYTFDIESKLKKISGREISRLLIYRKQSLANFMRYIGFLHPDKKKKLKRAIDSYVDYNWHFPINQTELRKFVITLLKKRMKIKTNGILRINSILKHNLRTLAGTLKKEYGIESKVYGPRLNGYGTTYCELVVQKKAEIDKIKNLLNSPSKYPPQPAP